MTSGLLRKTLRETWLHALLFGLALLVIEALLARLLPQLQQGLNDVLATLPILRSVAQALLGSEFGENFTEQALQAIAWVHPLVLSVVLAHVLIFCTRFPAGEIDRGTIDILLSWPASRRRVFLCESAVWLASGVWLMASISAGHYVAALRAGTDALPAGRILIVLVNLYCVYFAVGGVAYFVSAMSNDRGRAMAVLFALVVASFLLNFVAQLWPPAHRLAPLAVLSYYRPAPILADGGWPLGDMGVLVAVGAVFWLAALETFARRNICTV